MREAGGSHASGAVAIETALDDCLDRLQQGQGLEDCLKAHPDQRDELETLVRTALAVRESFARAQISEGQEQSLARARDRFMAEVHQRRRQTVTKAPTAWFGTLWRCLGGASRGLAAASLMFVLLAAILGGGSIASASSLPGDALYGVKRVSEQVVYFLTLSEAGRDALSREYGQRRVEEVKRVVAEQREATVEFSGKIDGLLEDESGSPIVVVQGIPVRLPESPSGPQADVSALTVGSEVRIAAKTQRDGTVEATALDVRGQPPAAQSAPSEQRPSPTPTVEPTDKPTETPPPTASATASPTLLATEPAPVLETVEPSETAAPAETAVPTTPATIPPSPTPSIIPTDTPTPLPTATPMPAPRDIQVRMEGVIEATDRDHWVLSGRRIELGVSTRIDQSLAKAQVGGWAIVEAVRKPDGRLVAQQIRITRSAEEPPQPREFRGVIESVQDNRWVVAGQAIVIASDTVIEGTAVKGAVAQVRADQYADGRLVARRIVVKAPDERVAQFEGLISEMSEGLWVVAGQQVIIAADTDIQGEASVGSIAEVEAVVRSDGTIVARRIRITG